jgi:hypothetical protein
MQHLDEGLLHELVDGEIPSIDLPPIQAHLAACYECRARLEEAREFAGEAERLVETIELTEEDPSRGVVASPRPRARPWGRDLAWAATVVVAVGAGYLARGGSRPDQLAEKESAAPAPVAAPGATPVSAPIIVAPAEPQRAADAVSDRVDEERKKPAAPADSRTPASAKDFGKTALVAAAEGKLGATGSPTQDTAQMRRKLGDTKLALEELVVTSAADKAAPTAALERSRIAAPAAPPAFRSGMRQELAAAANELRLDDQGLLSAGPKRGATPVEITISHARRLLSDTLRLIDGLTPLRLELVGAEVHVVYPLASGELALEQWLVDGRISYRLVAPTDFPPDSLKRLRERVRE